MSDFYLTFTEEAKQMYNSFKERCCELTKRNYVLRDRLRRFRSVQKDVAEFKKEMQDFELDFDNEDAVKEFAKRMRRFYEFTSFTLLSIKPDEQGYEVVSEDDDYE